MKWRVKALSKDKLSFVDNTESVARPFSEVSNEDDELVLLPYYAKVAAPYVQPRLIQLIRHLIDHDERAGLEVSAAFEDVSGPNHSNQVPSKVFLGVDLRGPIAVEPTRNQVQVKSEYDIGSLRSTAAMLLAIEKVELGDCVVVGRCLRAFGSARDLVVKMRDAIATTFINHGDELDNFLICGRSGTGKTFFIDELLGAQGRNLRFSTIDLADVGMCREEFVNALKAGGVGDGCHVTVIDECDKRLSEPWFREESLNVLTWNRKQVVPHRVFIFLGSPIGGVAKFVDSLSTVGGGVDLLSRLPVGNRFDFPRG